MPPRDWRLRVEDILEAVRRIREYARDMDRDTFIADQRTVDAVLRNLEIIGEAARHVPDEVTIRYQSVPWAEMRGIRNVIAHAYFGIDLAVIWKTVIEGLPPLEEALKPLLTSDGTDGDAP